MDNVKNKPVIQLKAQLTGIFPEQWFFNNGRKTR